MGYSVYKHTNLINRKSHIGITRISVAYRLTQHCGRARRGSMTAFHCALRKYGREGFTTEILHHVNDTEEAKRLEISEIATHKTYGKLGYNCTRGGDGQFDPTDATRAKMSAARVAFNSRLTPIQRAEVVARLTRGRLDPRNQEVMRASRSDTITRLNSTTKARERTIALNKNRIWSDISRAKVAAAKLGHKRSPESIAKQFSTRAFRNKESLLAEHSSGF